MRKVYLKVCPIDSDIDHWAKQYWNRYDLIINQKC